MTRRRFGIPTSPDDRRPVGGPIPTAAEFDAAIERFLFAVAIVAGLIAVGTLLIFLI